MWFYSESGNECSMGMSGGINVKSVFGDQKYIGVMMDKRIEANPDIQAALVYGQNRPLVLLRKSAAA